MTRTSITRTGILTLTSAMLLGACSGNGDNVVAGTGGSATATGGSATATGGNATATGGNASATGGNATGTGGNATATGGNATATGGNATATGGNATGTGGKATGTGGSATGTGGSATGTGGKATGTGGSATGTGGSATGTGGGSSSGCGVVGPTPGAPGFGTAAQAVTGNSAAKYATADVTRNGVSYRFITNWWGQGWTSANVSWNGTAFTVQSAAGTSNPDGTPIGYPTTYCGRYSESAAHGNCGLPAAYSTIDKLWTGWKWHSADKGQYNAAWDIWLGTASAFQSYLMVWLRDPAGRTPAGNARINNVTVANVPGTWSIIYGTVNNSPIVNYVRMEGQDACELEFNAMDFINDAKTRAATTSGLTLPGDTVRAVAVGFEFWTGPFTNVVSDDFYVKLVTK